MDKEETERYLARVRKTVAEARAAVGQAELRMAETDRMLERNGLTREQVMQMRFSDAQIEAANAELARRGLDPFEIWSAPEGDSYRPQNERPPVEDSLAAAAGGDELDERRKKFSMMMKPFQI